MATTERGVSGAGRARRERVAGGFRADGFVPDRTRAYTADEVRALNAANPRHWPRFECVGGRLLVTPAPAPPHQTITERLFLELSLYCRAHFPDAVPHMSPADISWGGQEHTVQPDVFVAPRAMDRAAWAAADSSAAAGWREIRHLLLVVEVLSPGTRRHDRATKRVLYQRRRVPLYWIVDGRRRLVEEWTPDATAARVERERLVWRPGGAAEPFGLPLATLFSPA